MFIKFSKCVFDLKKIDYLKFIVKANDIRINFAKMVTIKKWVESTTRRYVRTFIKFAKFYKKFIKKFNKIAKSWTHFFKKKKQEFDKMFKFIKKTRKTLKKMKEIFIKTSILLHFDLKRRIRLKIDVFDFAISKIILQLIEEIN
jgi:mevalonate kinase